VLAILQSSQVVHLTPPITSSQDVIPSPSMTLENFRRRKPFLLFHLWCSEVIGSVRFVPCLKDKIQVVICNLYGVAVRYCECWDILCFCRRCVTSQRVVEDSWVFVLHGEDHCRVRIGKSLGGQSFFARPLWLVKVWQVMCQ